ncbi:MAG: phage antirepressor N-terminal domain-containing protein [Anaerolineae bacterium]
MAEKALVPVEERTVVFYDDELTAVLVQEGDQTQVFVPLRPICKFLGVAWSPQRRRVNQNPILSEVVRSVTVTVTEAGQRGQMLCLPLDYLNGWLFGINATRVKAEVRERLLRYQRECYRVLAQAFTARTAAADLSPSMATLVQVREMGRAIMQMAEEQMEFERRLSTTETRLERAAVIVGELGQRVASLEERVAPGKPVTEEQASQISQAVKAVALASPQKNFGAVYGELYRKFGITSYKLLPAKRFDEAMKFLTEWHQSLAGDAPF